MAMEREHGLDTEEGTERLSLFFMERGGEEVVQDESQVSD